MKAEARKEGKLVIVSGAAAALRKVGMDKNLADKFGITVEYTAGLPSEVIPKVLAERRAGLYLEDIILSGGTNIIGVLKPAGVLEPLDEILFLPESMDPKAWYKGEVPWVDKEHLVVATLAIPKSSVIINTNQLKREDIKSYRDLLDPKWKGRIILSDPTKAGNGSGWFSGIMEGIMDLDYLRAFAKQQPVISRDERQMLEWVSQGKYPILVGGREEVMVEFVRAGAPIELMNPREGTYVTTSSAAVTMLKNAPHPNAAKLFANWMLTKEGGTFFSLAFGGQSGRVDVPTDHIDPSQLREPGVKYINSSNEEYALRQNDYLKLAQQIFADQLK